VREQWLGLFGLPGRNVILITLFIDNNTWDVFFADGLDLTKELPDGEFNLCVTKEVEFEMALMPSEKREYAQRHLLVGRVHTDSYFGFYDERLGPNEQRVSGFGELNDPQAGGRFVEEEEAAVINSEHRSISPRKRPTGLYKNEADVMLAARSQRGIVLTCDVAKKGPLKRAQGRRPGTVVDLRKWARGTPLADFIRSEISSATQT
jgi:hypothetical protein